VAGPGPDAGLRGHPHRCAPCAGPHQRGTALGAAGGGAGGSERAHPEPAARRPRDLQQPHHPRQRQRCGAAARHRPRRDRPAERAHHSQARRRAHGGSGAAAPVRRQPDRDRRRVLPAAGDHQAGVAGGSATGHRLRYQRVHPRRGAGGGGHRAAGAGAGVSDHIRVPAGVAKRADSAHHHPHRPHRGLFHHVSGGLLHQYPDAAGHGAGGGTGGGRRGGGAGEHLHQDRGGHAAPGGGHGGPQGDLRGGGGDDAGAGGGVRADSLSRRPHRSAVPGVRHHPGRGGGDLLGGGADPDPHAGLADAEKARHPALAVAPYRALLRVAERGLPGHPAGVSRRALAGHSHHGGLSGPQLLAVEPDALGACPHRGPGPADPLGVRTPGQQLQLHGRDHGPAG